MSVCWLYALLDTAPAGADAAARLTGLAGEPVRVVPVASVFAAVGVLEATPGVSEETLRRHDDTVRALVALAPSVLPARFGQGAATEDALLARVASRAPELARALDDVRGCEQMTLRAFGEPVEEPRADDELEDDPSLGPGARYLAARRRAQARAHEAPELAPLLAVLAPLVRATRVERSRVAAKPAGPALLASVYHLVRRGDDATYRALVDEHAPALAPCRVTLSGPWPAYAFAPS